MISLFAGVISQITVLNSRFQFKYILIVILTLIRSADNKYLFLTVKLKSGDFFSAIFAEAVLDFVFGYIISFPLD